MKTKTSSSSSSSSSSLNPAIDLDDDFRPDVGNVSMASPMGNSGSRSKKTPESSKGAFLFPSMLMFACCLIKISSSALSSCASLSLLLTCFLFLSPLSLCYLFSLSLRLSFSLISFCFSFLFLVKAPSSVPKRPLKTTYETLEDELNAVEAAIIQSKRAREQQQEVGMYE